MTGSHIFLKGEDGASVVSVPYSYLRKGIKKYAGTGPPGASMEVPAETGA